MHEIGNLSGTWAGILSFIVFVISYYFIIKEEHYNLNKAKPALFMGTFMFLIIGVYFVLNGLDTNVLHAEVQHLLLEITEIFFFLLVAMTYIEVLINRGVFDVLRKKLLTRGYTYKQLFWILGFLSFFLSPFADNLTTALILSTVLITISKDKKFLIPTAINIIVASNSGGAWSPFGDITTLMAWTADKGTFYDFLKLFPASFIGRIVTAIILSFYIKNKIPKKDKSILKAKFKPGAKKVIILGFFTIFMAVINQQLFNIPPVWGMMYGLALLQLTSYRIKHEHSKKFNIYKNIKKTEMDTLLFFFGILSAVGALGFLGFLDYIVNFYNLIGVYFSNILIGFLSAFIDNVPVMSAILKSNVDMGSDGWLFLTLTVGIGGSLINFGSAAGIGVMGKMKGVYTFKEHIKFFPIILLGYLVSIGVFYIQFNLF